MTAAHAPRTTTANALAADFYARGLSDCLLTARQADYLFGLYRRETGDDRRSYGKRHAAGVFTTIDGREIGWEANEWKGGAAMFRTNEALAARVEQEQAEREVTILNLYKSIRQLEREGRQAEAAQLTAILDQMEA